MTLKYYLSEAGRRASLLVGGDGKAEQCAQLPATAETLALANVDAEGHATIHAVAWYYPTHAAYKAPGALRYYEAHHGTVRVVGDPLTTKAWDRLDAPIADPEAFALGIPAANAAREHQAEAEAAQQRVEAETADQQQQVTVAAKTAEVEVLIARLVGGEGAIDTSPVYWVHLDGQEVTWRTGDISPDLQARLNAIASARRDQERREQAEADARQCAERDTWIITHGSTRLKKGLAAGLTAQMRGIYLDERIAHDLGAAWGNWQTAPEPYARERLNPCEAELDALIEARTRWPHGRVRLQSVGGDGHAWRAALLMTCPWEGIEVVRYLEADGDSSDHG